MLKYFKRYAPLNKCWSQRSNIETEIVRSRALKTFVVYLPNINKPKLRTYNQVRKPKKKLWIFIELVLPLVCKHLNIAEAVKRALNKLKAHVHKYIDYCHIFFPNSCELRCMNDRQYGFVESSILLEIQLKP